MRARQASITLSSLYERLLTAQGVSNWWPGETALEIALGAILVQHAPWRGAARALDNLRGRGLLADSARLRALSEAELEAQLRPAGTYRVKARRVRAFLDYLGRAHAGDAERLRQAAAEPLREELLAVPGIGPETADSIALYAGGHPFFVIDASTRRLLSRLGLAPADTAYDRLQARFHAALPREAGLFNEYHAQIVRFGQTWCRARPRCGSCPLRHDCPGSDAPAPVARPRRTLERTTDA